eukprot:7517839-Lingulodinium_polyedra.AAC.1
MSLHVEKNAATSCCLKRFRQSYFLSRAATPVTCVVFQRETKNITAMLNVVVRAKLFCPVARMSSECRRQNV